jgi:protein SCO1
MPANASPRAAAASAADGTRVPAAVALPGLRPQERQVAILLALALLLLFLASGCRRPPPPSIEDDGLVRHPLTGQVIRIDSERGTVLVDHDPIPGYMPAMVMEFGVTAGDLRVLREGQRIRATLVEEPEGFRLEKVWPVDERAESQVQTAAASLRQDTTIRGRKVYREVGENLPDFALYDQNGDVVTGARFRGQKVMLNFIYTRCPIATMCPLAVEHFQTVQRLAREQGVENLQLVSVTLDPEFDTPGVLREFADVRSIDTSNYSFLTGPEGAIKDLLAQFGVHAFLEGSLLQHTLATLLIDERGRIIHRADGSRWDPQEFVRRMTR